MAQTASDRVVPTVSEEKDFDLFYTQLLSEAGVRSWSPRYWRWFSKWALAPTPLTSELFQTFPTKMPDCPVCKTITADTMWPEWPEASERYKNGQKANRPPFALCYKHFKAVLGDFESTHPLVGFKCVSKRRKTCREWYYFVGFTFKWWIALRSIPFWVVSGEFGLSLAWAFDKGDPVDYDLEKLLPRVSKHLVYRNPITDSLGDACLIRNSDQFDHKVWPRNEIGLAYPVRGHGSHKDVLLFGYTNLANHACVHHHLNYTEGGKGFIRANRREPFRMGDMATVSYGQGVMGDECRCITCTRQCRCNKCIKLRQIGSNRNL